MVWESVNANDWWFSLWIKHIITFIQYRQNDGWVCELFFSRRLQVNFDHDSFFSTYFWLYPSFILYLSIFLFFNIFFFDFCSCFFHVRSHVKVFYFWKSFVCHTYMFMHMYVYVYAGSNEWIKYFCFFNNININTMRFMLDKALSTNDITHNRSTRTRLVWYVLKRNEK